MMTVKVRVFLFFMCNLLVKIFIWLCVIFTIQLPYFLSSKSPLGNGSKNRVKNY